MGKVIPLWIQPELPKEISFGTLYLALLGSSQNRDLDVIARIALRHCGGPPSVPPKEIEAREKELTSIFEAMFEGRARLSTRQAILLSKYCRSFIRTAHNWQQDRSIG